jgi:Domain of unknown function (DUF4124)
LPRQPARTRWVDAHGNVIYSDQPPPPNAVAPRVVPGAPAVVAPAAPETPARSHAFHPSAERLLDATGVKHQARLIALQTRDTLRGNLGKLDGDRRRRVDAITDREFHPDHFYGLLRSEFSRHVNEPRLNEVLAWYATPVGRRVSAAEVRFYASDRRREVEEFVAGLVNNRPSPIRLALLQRLDAASGATEGSLDLFVAINHSIIRVVEPLLPAPSRIGAGQRESQARLHRLLRERGRRLVRHRGPPGRHRGNRVDGGAGGR